MPKIIENPEARILAAAHRLVQERGYQALTIRAVASGCGLGVGTVYNYFPSKEALLSCYLLGQWQKCVDCFQAECCAAQTAKDAMHAIYRQLISFGRQYQPLVHCPEAVTAFLIPQSSPSGAYHALLMGQLTQSLRRFCCSDFTAKLVGHALLGFTMAGYAFEDIAPVLIKMLDHA